jgi:16S rRNA C1402 (ribose-2'-O) methylase RsmI
MVAFDLTLPGERIYRGEVADVAKEIGGKKGEFMLVVGR